MREEFLKQDEVLQMMQDLAVMWGQVSKTFENTGELNQQEVYEFLTIMNTQVLLLLEDMHLAAKIRETPAVQLIGVH